MSKEHASIPFFLCPPFLSLVALCAFLVPCPAIPCLLNIHGHFSAMKIIEANPFQRPVFLFSPTEKPKSQILLLHGICEHSMRYRHFAESLVAEGYAVAIMDHQAHGFTIPGTENLRSLIDSYSNTPNHVLAHLPKISDEEQKTLYHSTDLAWKKTCINDLVDDYQALAQWLFDEKHFDKEIDLHVMGHSMGGLIATALAPRLCKIADINVKRLILSSPAFRPGFNPDSIGRFFLMGVHKFSWFCKSHDSLYPLSRLFEKILTLKGSESTKWAANYISDLAIETQIYKDDPLLSQFSRLSFLFSIETLMVETLKLAPSYPLPISLACADEDKIVNSQGSVDFAASYRKTHLDEELDLLLFKQLNCHEILRSSQHKVCRDFIIKALEK